MKESTIQQSWKNIWGILRENRSDLSQLLTDDEMRIRVQFICTYMIFTCVSAVMTIINVLTGFEMLMYSTLIFAVANLLNILLTLSSLKCEKIARVLFGIEILLLFLFFIISGEPQGFSAIWIVLLPTCGMLLYRIKFGTILSLIQFVILIIMFWTSFGNSLLHYQYTESFLLRFPFLYLSSLAIGLFFEVIRMKTQQELVETRNKYEYLSCHDHLTGLYNRIGFNEDVNNMIESTSEDGVGFAIIDLDYFKNVNDSFGHICGDFVLKETARLIEQVVGDRGKVSRWGGEEFSIIFTSYEYSELACEEIMTAIRAREFDFNGLKLRITASIGLVRARGGEDTDKSNIVFLADENLYKAKDQGRNRLITTDI